MTINSLLVESMKMLEEEREQIEKKTPEWIAQKDKTLVTILNKIIQSKDK